ncbi:MAG: hypothetical protein ABSG68_15495 [Thermoguttaceae bacterium]|jgi:hypothetical protein
MDGWNVAILVVAVYVAVVTLVRLMNGRRKQLMNQFRQEVENERRRRGRAAEPRRRAS